MISHGTIEAIYEKSFRANLYTPTHFRMIGLIDVQIAFEGLNEKVTLAFYSSSGTNSGKLKGLWYPIAGIKLFTGPFVEFTPIINQVLTQTTYYGDAHYGWLAKSLFFPFHQLTNNRLRGFGDPPYYDDLFPLGETLQNLYESGQYTNLSYLDPPLLNQLLMTDQVYPGNKRSQKENFDAYIKEIYNNSFVTPNNYSLD